MLTIHSRVTLDTFPYNGGCERRSLTYIGPFFQWTTLLATLLSTRLPARYPQYDEAETEYPASEHPGSEFQSQAPTPAPEEAHEEAAHEGQPRRAEGHGAGPAAPTPETAARGEKGTARGIQDGCFKGRSSGACGVVGCFNRAFR